MKVLFIDDEPLIRRGLRAVIPWEKYGFTEFLEAEDGTEGLEIIEKYNPSLIIVDICMHNKSGIVMADEARKNKFTGRMIILSGYSDFEYAKSAIEADVTAYLVKPVNPDELTKAVEKAINELHRASIISIFSSQPAKLHRKTILADLITGKISYTTEIENTYHFNFNSTFYRLISIYKLRDLAIVDDKKDFLTGFKKNFLSVPISETEMVFLITSMTQLQKFMQQYQSLSSTSPNNNDYFIIISTLGRHPDVLTSLYNENREIYKYLYYYKHHNNLIDSISLKQQLKNLPTTYNLLTVTNELITNILLLDYNEVQKLLISFYEYLFKNKPSINNIEYMMMNCYSQILQQLSIHYPSLKYDICSDVAFSSSFRSNDFLIDSFDFFEKQLNIAINHIKRSVLQNPCKRICQYIESNAREPLKLETIANIFGYNSAYLGKLFHKETGMHFNTYLDHLRIEYSKEYLKHGVAIAIACENSGFHNTDYFTKKFKKYVGVLPSEYKKQYSESLRRED